MSFKEKIYEILQEETIGTKANRFFDKFIIVLVSINLIVLILGSITSMPPGFVTFSNYFEIFSVIIFTIEYIIRIYVADKFYPCNNKLKSIGKFFISKHGIIDLLAILPFYLPLFFNCNLLFLRLLRLLKFIRGLKIFRYNQSLNIILNVLYKKKKDLMMTGSLALTVMIVASVLMYYTENSAQPDKFPDILSCFWWSIATLTTIGYGDVYPITGLGKIIAGSVAIVGIGLVSLPTAILSMGFMENISSNNEHTRVNDIDNNHSYQNVYSCRNKCGFLYDNGTRFYCMHTKNKEYNEIDSKYIINNIIPDNCPIRTNETIIKYKIIE